MDLLVILLIIAAFFILVNAVSGGGQEPNRNSRKMNNYQDRDNTYKITVSVEDLSDNYRRKPDPLDNAFEKFWISKDKEIVIQGYKISNGLIYVGKNLSAANDNNYRSTIEPALINPDRPLNRLNPDYDGQSLSYWPSYRGLRPEARAAYLEWLASDRDDPDTPIGYVFLYYYGLERRILYDAQYSTRAENELPYLTEEINRLLSLYGSNRSFRGYATNLIEFLEMALHGSEGLKQAVEKENLDFTQYRGGYYEHRLNFKKGLAYFALNEKPLPAGWALKWALPQASLRTPALRCKDKFQQLFQKRYEQVYEDGIIIKPGNRALRISYRPASHSFGYGSISQKTNIPDVPNLHVPLKRISKLIEKCTDELDPYSRYLGRNPDDTDSVQALSNLPAVLLKEYLTPGVQEFIRLLDSKLEGNQYALLDTDHFTDHWDIKGVNKFRKRESIEIARFLFKLGYGIEPDLRFGSAKFERDSQVVIFSVDPQTYPKSPSKEYKLALLILHLTTVVGLADGTLSPKEEQHLDQYIEEIFQLSQEEKTRLNAYLYWLKAENPGVRGIKKKISSLDQSKKESIMEFLIKVANADGYIGPGEVEILQKIAEIFEMDSDQIFTAIHTHQTSDEDPMLIIQGENKQGYTIPEDKKSSKELDKQLINKTLEETDQVQSILSDIFSEEDRKDSGQTLKEKSTETVLGLDELHSQLVLKLIIRQQWSRMEYENLCSEHGVFPDGALEMINEKCYDEFDDVLLIDAEQLELNQEIVNEINA